MMAPDSGNLNLDSRGLAGREARSPFLVNFHFQRKLLLSHPNSWNLKPICVKLFLSLYVYRF